LTGIHFKQKLEFITDYFLQYPTIAEDFLTGWTKDYEFLFCIILSAQSTDRQVNKITPRLFSTLKTLEEFDRIKTEDLEELIKSPGFYKAKARNIKNITKYLLENTSGKVPQEIDELVKIPGIGRKSANVFLWGFYSLSQGFPVDTHVGRVTGRLGLHDFNQKNALKIEPRLMEIFPEECRGVLHQKIIKFGRDICTARNRDCNICPLNKYCRYYLES
jgi:endonuclease III